MRLKRVPKKRVVFFMSTIVELVSSTPVHGGLSDGYRRSQLGQPSGTVGQPPRFRGETNKPGDDVKAPRILSSAARHNRATNVTIPYPRVTPADELCGKGRLSPGDVAFISRYQYGKTSEVRMNQNQQAQITTSVSTAHADVSRMAGLDYVNRALHNYVPGSTVLVDSVNPLDDWRSLTFLNEWTMDGIVMSNDSPGYVMSSSGGARNDQLFNMCIQGPVQLNNGYEDDAGRGLAANHDRQRQLAAGNLALKQPEGMNRQQYVQNGSGANSIIPSLVAGPFYSMYPLQMFDRKIRPLSDLYIGLICRKIDNSTADRELDAVNAATGNKFRAATHIHIFQYVCFSSRQVYQNATEGNDPTADDPDYDIVDTGIRNGRNGRATNDYNLGDSEPADRRRGPNDPKRGRTDNYLPRKRQADTYDTTDTFLGIKRKELLNMVGAWRIGKVLDVASQRMEGYTGGPIDTAFKVTLNTDISFLDWRQLRRNFVMNIFGWELDVADGNGGQHHWETYNAKHNKFDFDVGRVMQWPTWYDLDDFDSNVPINPELAGQGYNYGTRFSWPVEQPSGTMLNPTEQKARYRATVDALYGELTMAVPSGAVLSIGSAAGHSQQAQDAAVAQKRVAPVQAPPPSAGALSFPEQVVRPPAEARPPAPVAAPKGKEKAAPSAATAPVVATVPPSQSVQAPPPPAAKAAAKAPAAKSTAAPKAAPKATQPTVGAIGDDVMASIFGSAAPSSADVGVASGSSAPSADKADASERSKDQPKSFPRRRDR